MSQNKDKVVEYYDHLAKDYDRDRFGNSYGRFIDAEERAVLSRWKVKDSGRVLEVACGTGRLLDFAAAGCDASSEMLAVAREKHPGKELICSRAEAMPLPDGSLDTIYSLHLMMHLEPQVIKSILREASRLLRPGGRLIFDIPSAPRRRLLHKERSDWHGSTSLSRRDVEEMSRGLFTLRRSAGIMMLPVHKLPARLRPMMLGVDKALCASPLKAYSSYLIYELIKD